MPTRKSAGIRVILIDDNELLRAGIRSLISAGKDIEIVGEATDKTQAAGLIRDNRPDVILLNTELKRSDGLEMISDLLGACKTSRMVVLTTSKDPGVHRHVMSKGAIGIVAQEDAPGSLIDAVRRVHSGGVWLDHFVTAKMIKGLSSENHGRNHSPDEKKIATLTAREREVIRLVGEGLKNKQIAQRLFISHVTVHHHLTAIFSKLDVKDRLELIVYAYKNRLADVPR